MTSGVGGGGDGGAERATGSPGGGVYVRTVRGGGPPGAARVAPLTPGEYDSGSRTTSRRAEAAGTEVCGFAGALPGSARHSAAVLANNMRT